VAVLPDPWRKLSTELASLRKLVGDLSRRSPFYASGMELDGLGGVQSIDFDGDLAAGNAGTTGWAMNAARAAFGELFLRPGSIGNDSLTNPVDGKVGNVSASGFALTVAFAELAGQNITVPAGFTQALITAGSTVFSYNPNTTGGSNGAGGDAIYAMVQVTAGGTSQASHANPVGVSGSGGYATSFSAAGFELTGLTGGSTIRLAVYGSSAYAAIASNVDNYANAYASITWLR
jgi:hypothetical protein